MKFGLLNLFSKSERSLDQKSRARVAQGGGFGPALEPLAFDELNPLLAKQLSELEVQIGQLAQVQFELSEERSRMRHEMDALKKVLQDSQTQSSPQATPQVIVDNEAT